MAPRFDSISLKVKSKFDKIWDSLYPTRDGTSRRKWFRESQTSRTDGSYRNLEGRKAGHDLDPYPLKGVTTCVSADHHGHLTDSDIHLTVDIRQE